MVYLPASFLASTSWQANSGALQELLNPVKDLVTFGLKQAKLTGCSLIHMYRRITLQCQVFHKNCHFYDLPIDPSFYTHTNQ